MFFFKLVRDLEQAEEKGDRHTLLVRHFKYISYVTPQFYATEDLSNYLIKCCLHLNEFFNGVFELSISNISDIAGMGDEEKIGRHWITEILEDTRKLEKLIEEGSFDFNDSEKSIGDSEA